jgi:hypothetical protein
MDGLYFLMNIVAIGWLMFWIIGNDQPGYDGKTFGLFAMRDAARPDLPQEDSSKVRSTPGWRSARNPGRNQQR